MSIEIGDERSLAIFYSFLGNFYTDKGGADLWGFYVKCESLDSALDIFDFFCPDHGPDKLR
jgi:hypothetical protein